MANRYLNVEAESILKKLQRPGQSYSGIIIERLGPLIKHEKN
jgi:hypothetical protein